MKSKNNVIGVYYKTDSFVHSLDPRIKLSALLFYSIASICLKVNSPLIQVALFCSVYFFALISSKIPLSVAFGGFRQIAILIFVLVFFNLFISDGNVLLEIWKIKITDLGLKTALINAIRFLLLYFGGMLISYTTTPGEMMKAISSFVSPLKKFSFPADDFVTVLLLALRFIPVISGEYNSICLAQKSRGARLEDKNPLKRVMAYTEVFIPLIVSSFRKADEISQSLESRCYGLGEKRTCLRKLRLKNSEKLFFVIYTIYILIIFIMGVKK